MWATVTRSIGSIGKNIRSISFLDFLLKSINFLYMQYLNFVNKPVNNCQRIYRELLGSFTVGHFSLIFDSIFVFIFIAFYLKMKLRIKKEMDMKMLILKKRNPNLAFTRSDPFLDHFSPFWHCAWGKMHFPIIFLKFPFQSVHGKHFSHHFVFHF